MSNPTICKKLKTIRRLEWHENDYMSTGTALLIMCSTEMIADEADRFDDNVFYFGEEDSIIYRHGLIKRSF